MRGRKLIRDLLEVQGYATLTADDGVKAIAAAKEKLPDLILMDIQLPRMDGVTAMKKLKAYSKTANIPVIALTAYAMQGDEERLLRQGFDDFLTKPVDIHALLQRVQFHLGK